MRVNLSKILFIIGMIVFVSWVVGKISHDVTVGVMAGTCCVAYICYQSAKEDDE